LVSAARGHSSAIAGFAFSFNGQHSSRSGASADRRISSNKNGGTLPRRRYGRSAEAAFRGLLIKPFQLIFAHESFATRH
jgi:hypothetical protein